MTGAPVHVLVVNAGSSSLKLRLLDAADEVVDAVALENWDGADTAELERFVRRLPSVDAVGHRIVHGGRRFSEPVRIDDEVREAIGGLADLAPLHQPRGVAGIDTVAQVLPGTPAVACFDTAFHTTIPDAAATYALPAEWNRRWGLRRYGFHGLSHAYVTRRAAELTRPPEREPRIVSCHLGAGASLAAVAGGRSVDTTMGFTPLAGLVMATRTGSVDPGLVLWLQQQAGMDADFLSHALERESGLAGLSGGTGDMREIMSGMDSGDEACRLAFDVYVHRLRREIAAMTGSLGGIDVLVFTGGVGEHNARVRAEAAGGLRYLGVTLDTKANEACTGEADISGAAAPVRTLVVPAREDLEIAAHTRRTLAE
ncbi:MULTISPECIES: acetate/propionate family kinase [Prauserella salsuginis group]|uniref:Acetate kinase n=1 Tax=Prauserella salsuginis TaxID=387889 RepID=A0ABW6G1S5_9PSEU|nr:MULTISPECIES: acetate/propionate family kinase [Prauserella salsuginis group]